MRFITLSLIKDLKTPPSLTAALIGTMTSMSYILIQASCTTKLASNNTTKQQDKNEVQKVPPTSAYALNVHKGSEEQFCSLSFGVK